jgi:acetyl esterase/lipase
MMLTMSRIGLRSSVSAGLIWLCSACSPVSMLNSVIPENGYQYFADISYGETPRHKLDIYLSNHSNPEALRKTVMFFYGGSWESGHKEDYKFVAQALTSAGFDVVIPDYRVYPGVVFPEFVNDAALAVSWSYNHLVEFGANPKRLFVAGHSAGAHIAALLALDPLYLKRYQLSPDSLGGMIGLAGPYDFLPLKSDTLKTIFGPEDERWRSQPINFVDGKNPPMLLLLGDDDSTVWPKNSRNLATKIREKGGNVELVEFKDYDHVDMVAKLAKPLRGDEKLLQTITEFIHRNSHSNAAFFMKTTVNKKAPEP